jgi:hypothetical protein
MRIQQHLDEYWFSHFPESAYINEDLLGGVNDM